MKVGIQRISRPCQPSLPSPPRVRRTASSVFLPHRGYGAQQKKGRLTAPLGIEVEGAYISLFFWMTLGVKKMRSSFFVLSVS
jgi:hypothetical protein